MILVFVLGLGWAGWRAGEEEVGFRRVVGCWGMGTGGGCEGGKAVGGEGEGDGGEGVAGGRLRR